LALRSPYVQIQFKSRATGSVVDALEPNGIADVQIPLLDESNRHYLGSRAEEAWENIARAFRIEEAAVAELEEVILRGYELGQ
jgi:hypothetical protein